MRTSPGKRLCSVFGRISSIQLKTATTVQIVREIGARMITPCKNNRSRFRGALRIVDMYCHLVAKITTPPQIPSNYKKNDGNYRNGKSFLSFAPTLIRKERSIIEKWTLKTAY